jgi:hypothetical protein
VLQPIAENLIFGHELFPISKTMRLVREHICRGTKLTTPIVEIEFLSSPVFSNRLQSNNKKARVTGKDVTLVQ